MLLMTELAPVKSTCPPVMAMLPACRYATGQRHLFARYRDVAVLINVRIICRVEDAVTPHHLGRIRRAGEVGAFVETDGVAFQRNVTRAAGVQSHAADRAAAIEQNRAGSDGNVARVPMCPGLMFVGIKPGTGQRNAALDF